MSEEKYKKVVTPKFRVSYPHIFKPQKPLAGSTGNPKYAITMLIPKVIEGTAAEKAAHQAKIDAIKTVVKEALIKEWGTDASKRPKGLKNPVRDGDTDPTYSDKPECKGMLVLTARNETKPGLIDANMQPILSEKEFYAGCYARATIQAFAYNHPMNKGIALSLQNVQKLEDGAAFTSRARAEDDFGPADTSSGGSKEASDFMD